MATEMTPADLQNTVCCRYGSFVPFNLRQINAPRDLNGNFCDANSTSVSKHFFRNTNPLSFTLLPMVPGSGTRLLQFGAARGTKDILFLEFYVNQITSTVIPTNNPVVCYFTTDELSGCNFFIDQLPNGNLVCLHANARQYSTTKEQLKVNAAAFNEEAVREMDRQHTTALTLPAYQGARRVYQLRAAEYYAKAQSKVDEKVRAGYKGVEFSGGSFVMGFRVNGTWQFWFQTYGRITYTIPGGLFKKDQVINTNNAPLEKIEVRRFWPR